MWSHQQFVPSCRPHNPWMTSNLTTHTGNTCKFPIAADTFERPGVPSWPSTHGPAHEVTLVQPISKAASPSSSRPTLRVLALSIPHLFPLSPLSRSPHSVMAAETQDSLQLTTSKSDLTNQHHGEHTISGSHCNWGRPPNTHSIQSPLPTLCVGWVPA